MHPLTLIVVTVLLPTVCTMKCYKCTGSAEDCLRAPQTQCPSWIHQCSMMRITSYAGDTGIADVHMKNCFLADECVDGSVSFGISRIVVSSECCDTNLCNTKLTHEPNNTSHNGKKCYYCTDTTCSGTLNCVGDEDHCISKTVTKKGEKKIVKGCASKTMCSNKINPQIRTAIGAEISCCQGDYCNSASSTSAGLLLLVTPLLSLVMFS